MGRKVEENHKVVAEAESPAADLIQQQEEFTFEEEPAAAPESKEPAHQEEPVTELVPVPEPAPVPEPGPKQEEEEKQEKQPKKILAEYWLILTGAASYTGCGMRFFKNQPVQIADETTYKKLLTTGLFVKR